MKTFLSSLRMLAVLTLLTGVAYPLLVTALARAMFPRQAQGSLLLLGSQVVGSELLAQRFAEDKYFWPRPSAVDNGTNYSTVPSGASNLGPTSSNLVATVAARAIAFRIANGLGPDVPLPPDLIFASGSGVDPHISPEAVRLQINRVAQARHFTAEQKEKLALLVQRGIERPQLGFLGEPRVNVLKLNLALDSLR